MTAELVIKTDFFFSDLAYHSLKPNYKLYVIPDLFFLVTVKLTTLYPLKNKILRHS